MVLMILDGFGERADTDDNAVRLAETPRLAALYAKYPHGLIGTSGPDVGLPPGQMGNSEVGHLNFGAGRIAMMDISRIDNAVHDGTLAKNPVIGDVLAKAKAAGGKLHLLGLVSDGGVHSSLQHLFALIDTAHAAGVPVVVHAFLDGRDVAPGSAPGFLEQVEARLVGKGAIGTVSGRYWAMDRDNRWERVEKAYRAIVLAEGPRAAGAFSVEAHGLAAGGIFIRFRPAFGARHHLHAVGAQHVQLARGAGKRHLLQIGIAGNQQVAEQGLQHLGAALARIGPLQKVEQRMGVEFASALIGQPGQRAGGFRDHAHAAIDDRIAGKALPRQRGIVARRPHRPALALQRDEGAGGRGLGASQLAGKRPARRSGGRGARLGSGLGSGHGNAIRAQPMAEPVEQ